MLTFSASGVSALVTAEPCAAFEQTAQDDGACAPTCVTCGCCAMAVEATVVTMAATPAVLVAEVSPLVPPVLPSASHDILHVPKLRAA